MMRPLGALDHDILEVMPGGVVHVAADGAIRTANSEACRILGLTFDELTRCYTADFASTTCFEDGRPCSVDDYPVTKALRTGERQPPTTIGVGRPDGTISWAVFSALPVRDASGATSGAVVTFLDITDRKRAEDERNRSEARFRSIVESTPNTILTADLDGTILLTNREFPESGAPQLVGRSIYEQVHEDDVPIVRRTVEEVVRSRSPTSYEARGPRAMQDRWFHVSVGPLVIDDRVVGITMTAAETTSLKRLQEQLAMSDRLASIGTLAAGVAHEINNPLAYVLLSLHDVVRRCGSIADAAVRETITQLTASAIEGAERIQQVARSLRSFSYTDADPARVDVHELLESTLRIAHHELRYRARVERVYGELPPVLINAGALSQVLLNVIVNASHAIEEGRPDDNSIRIVTRALDDRVRIEIHDTGCGMPPEVLERVFEPFVTTKPRGQGTGLGLYITHTLVRAVGGDISIDSAPGRGTCVSIELPVGAATGSAADRQRAVPQPNSRRLRVLVVDDEAGIHDGLVAMLAEHDITGARDGAAALELIGSRDFDLILCDLVMPVMTGMELFDHVATRLPHLLDRFVFMTGGAFTPSARDFAARIENRLIDKPFDEAALRGLLAARAAG